MMQRLVLGLALCALLALGSPLSAQIFRWVDDKGVTHYSTTPPPQTAERERRVLDRTGQEREVLGGAGPVEDRESQAEARQAARLAAEQHQREQQRAQQLRMLYVDESDILAQRDRRMALVRGNMALSESQAALLQREHDRIAAQVETATQRNDTRNLERYQRELADLDQRLEREQAHRDRQQAMLDDIEAQAATDLDDFRRLVVAAEE